MTGFKSATDYEEFARAVRSKRRFIHSTGVSAFLQVVSVTSKDREVVQPAGSTLWRAQIGSRDWHRSDDSGQEHVEDAPFPPERMKPLTRNPSEGRVNPRGIAYLYLATDRKTAISEVRAWKGALVSVASFRIMRDVRLVDCSKYHLPIGDWDKELSQEQIDEAVWASIDNAFSFPVGPGDEYVSYVPTQIIAEQFLADGFDGIAYKSALSKEGYNVALFDVQAANLTTCQLFNVTRVDYEFEEWSGAWFLQDGRYFTQVITDILPVNEAQPSEGAADDATDTSEQGSS
jgi:hypothetical protein